MDNSKNNMQLKKKSLEICISYAAISIINVFYLNNKIYVRHAIERIMQQANYIIKTLKEQSEHVKSMFLKTP